MSLCGEALVPAEILKGAPSPSRRVISKIGIRVRDFARA